MTEQQYSTGQLRRSGVQRVADGLDWLNDVIGRGTAWICLIMVMLVAVNVILRYLFRMGPVALQELEWHLMSPIALIGMVYAMRQGDHVRVDIFYEKFGPRLRDCIDMLAAATTVIVSVIIIILSLGFVEQAYVIGEGSPDPGGLPYRFILRAFIPLGFTLLALQGVSQFLRIGLRLLRRN